MIKKKKKIFPLNVQNHTFSHILIRLNQERPNLSSDSLRIYHRDIFGHPLFDIGNAFVRLFIGVSSAEEWWDMLYDKPYDEPQWEYIQWNTRGLDTWGTPHVKPKDLGRLNVIVLIFFKSLLLFFCIAAHSKIGCHLQLWHSAEKAFFLYKQRYQTL